MDESAVRPAAGRPSISWSRDPQSGGGAHLWPAPPPPDMDDLAYLVNQVQQRDPPIMHAHARYADDGGRGEPTVLVFDTDTGELVWRVPLTGLLQLAARLLRLNPQLVISGRRRARRQPPARPGPTMNDLAYLVNRVQPAADQRQVLQARAEIVEPDEGREPTVRVVDTATNEEVMAFPLNALLRLAAAFRISYTGLVFQAQA